MLSRGTVRLTVVFAVVAVLCLVGAIWAGSASVSVPGPVAGRPIACGTALTPSTELDELSSGGTAGGLQQRTFSEPVNEAIEACQGSRARQQILEGAGAAVAVFLGAVVVLRLRRRTPRSRVG
ncbi:hypothetical protein FHX82_003567 [Amycolatopsis bartoniae]|uniref:Uncharacterized protein n=1 Tax=Amycolatopsis bartoniae TaxID=941986 RepID=A0A8H9J2J0_9PSEU|nr:hypothetical protein [Amycolatopsis bartoniae]MBB2936503.1 hypothetical protein [Amycolatopsis bartoniae]TVT11017.1 hypothetical protein FNH07_03215 [Amycolatopsis bartoniae]GHF68478.1 hypothetical protein GCM10017566_47870 [Amycolatopsis bartoniae]